MFTPLHWTQLKALLAKQWHYDMQNKLIFFLRIFLCVALFMLIGLTTRFLDHPSKEEILNGPVLLRVPQGASISSLSLSSLFSNPKVLVGAENAAIRAEVEAVSSSYSK